MYISCSSPIPILTYHQIEKVPPRGTAFRSLYVSPAAFACQMRLLKILGYQGLSMSNLMPYLRGERKGKVVGITFDDGYLNNLTHALPVLVKNNFSATCYAVSQMLGKTNSWDNSLGIAQTKLMNASQLRQWVAGGQEVGAHTRQHVQLTSMEAARSLEEINLCKTDLENILDVPVQHFCYPYGLYSGDHLEMVNEAGFISATTTNRGRCWGQEDLFQLPRIPVLRTTSSLVLWLKLETSYENRRRT